MTIAVDNNDINAMLAIPRQIMGGITTMAGQAITPDVYTGGKNDIVLDNMLTCPICNNTEVNAINDVNNSLIDLAAKLQIPMADMTGYPYGFVTVHPDANGSQWIASKIADAYEHNRIPLTCDFNNDHIVNFIDFAVFANNWLQIGN